MKSRRFIVGLTTLAVFLAGGLVACSDDDNPTGDGDVGGDEGTVNSLVFELILPLIQALNLGPYLDQFPSQGTVTPSQCLPLDVCSSGLALFCPGVNSFDITFTDCNASGLLINGIVAITGDGTAGFGTMSLALGDYTVVGEVAYTNAPGENCYDQFFTNFAVLTGNLEMTMGGFFSYCPPDMVGELAIPSFGEIKIQIPFIDRAIDVVISSDPQPGSLEILVLNLIRDEVLLICSGNILGGMSCSTGQE